MLAGLGTISNLKLGLAYRDPQDDKFNVLLRYEYRQNPSIVPDSLLLGSGSGYTDQTLALEAIYAPNWQWEFYGKIALRNSTTTIAQDFVGTSSTNLSQFRVTYRMGYNFELVGETRLLNQPTANYSEMGLVGELGYYLTPNLRLAAGYSTGSINADRDFSGTRAASGLYAGITVKLNELFDGFGLQKMPPRQQQEPMEPQVPVAQPEKPALKLAAAIPDLPQNISLNVTRSLTFKNNQQGNSTELAVADIAVLENLVAVLKEYNNLSLDIQGHIGSLADMNTGDNLAANRMMAARKYLLDRGVASTQMTLRSLGGLTASANSPEKVSTALPISFALNGKADVFNAIATRLQTMSSNSPATEFLQSILPNANPTTLQANAAPVNANPASKPANISIGINVSNDGRIADLSYATLDRIIERLKASPNANLELQTNAISSNAATQDLEMFKLVAVRNYLLDKGISSDRILLSANSTNASSGTSQVYISMATDDSNSNIANKPASTAPIANANNIPKPLALLLETERRLSNWIESAIPDATREPLFKPTFNDAIQIPNPIPKPLTQLSNVESLMLALAHTEDSDLLTSDKRDRLWSYAFESLNALRSNESIADSSPNNNENNTNIATNDMANRRLATAFNFLLNNNGDPVTAFLSSIGISTAEKSGFAINPDQFSNLKN